MPTKIAWKPFYSNLPPPALKGPGGFNASELPVLRKNRSMASTTDMGATVAVRRAHSPRSAGQEGATGGGPRDVRATGRLFWRGRLWPSYWRVARTYGARGPSPSCMRFLLLHACVRLTFCMCRAALCTQVDVAAAGPQVGDDEIEYWFKIMQEKMTTRFAELRRAFRTLDEDASGNLDRQEFKTVLIMFNLGIPDAVMEKLIDLADYDGDGTINFAEFARIFTAESVLNMKKTLQAVEGNAHAAKVRYEMSQGGKGKLDKETGENVKLRRTGPGLEKMRKAHRTLRNIILTRFGSMKAAFADIDADGSGMLRRGELRTWLARVSKSIPDSVISGLISYVDTDGDTKTLSKEEFLRMMSEEFLDSL